MTTRPLPSTRLPISSATGTYSSLTWSEVGRRVGGGCGDDSASKISSLTSSEKDFNLGHTEDGQKLSGLGSNDDDVHMNSSDDGQNHKNCGTSNIDGRPRSIGISTAVAAGQIHQRRGSYESKISNLSNSSSDEKWDDDDGMPCNTTNLNDGSAACEEKKELGPNKQLPHDEQDEKQAEKSISRKRAASKAVEDEEAASFVFFARSMASSSSSSCSGSTETGVGVIGTGTGTGSNNIKRRKVTLASAETESSTGSTFTGFSSSSRQRTFPEQLIDMLNKEARSSASGSILCWMPDGKSFLVRDPDRLCREILPRYFPHSKGCAKFDSFRRKLYRWGFKLRTEFEGITNGNDDDDDMEMTDLEYELLRHDSMQFYHRHFRRSDPRMCLRMKSVIAPRGKNKKKKAEMEAEAKASASSNPGVEVKDGEREIDSAGTGETERRSSGGSNQAEQQEILESTKRASPGGTEMPQSGPRLSTPSQEEAERAAAMGAAAGAAATPEPSLASSVAAAARGRTRPAADARMLPPPPRVLSVPVAAAPGAAASIAAAAMTNAGGGLSPTLATTIAGSAIPTAFCSSPPMLSPLQPPAAALVSQVPNQSAPILTVLQALEEHRRRDQERRTNELSERIVRTIAEYRPPQPRQQAPSPLQARADGQLAEVIRGAVDRAMRTLARQEDEAMALIVHAMCLSAAQQQQQQQYR